MIGPVLADGLLWRWLSGIFIAPLDASSLRTCTACLDEIEANNPDPALLPGLQRMRTALVGLPQGEEGVVDLARTYTLLFSGAGGPLTVSPYESAYTTPNGRL